MSKNLVIWIMGGNSVGKTTNAKLIHNWFNEVLSDPIESKIVAWIEKEKKCIYTISSLVSAHVGELSNKQCCGTDTLNSKFQIQRSFEEAIKEREVVILDGIMSTGQWINFLSRPDVILWVVLLDVGEQENFKRLRQRRGTKRGIDPGEVTISAKTEENLAGKLRGFRSLFARMSPSADYANIIDTNSLNQAQVGSELLVHLKKILTEARF